MRGRYEEFRALGAEVVVICSARPEQLSAFLAGDPLPFPALSDPARSAYRALGLGRTSWGALLRGGVLLRYLGLIFRGWLPRRGRGEDVLQLGGDFVLDGGRRVVYAYRSAEPTDRPPVEELLGAVRAAEGAMG